MGAPQTALTMPDGTVQSVDNDRIPEFVAKGATPPEFVRVTLPTGAESEVPWDTYVALSQQRPGEMGLTSQASIDAQGHLSDLEDDTSAVGAFGRHALSELTFGAYKPDEDQELADRSYHDIASTVGSITGMAAPLLIPGLGEASLLREANLAREGLTAGRAARVGVELLPGRMTAQLGAKVYEAAGGGLRGALAGGAIEGAGTEVLRSVLDRDHRLSGESILDSAGMFTAGAGIGYGLSKAADVAGQAFSKLGRRAERAALKVDDADLVARLESNRPPTAAQHATTEDIHAKDVLGNVQHDVPLYSVNKELERDARRMFKEVDAWRSSPLAQVDPRIASYVDQGMESLKVLRNFAVQEPGIQSKVMGAYESHLHNVDEMATALARAPGGLDITKVTQRWRPENVAARQEAISRLDPTGLAPAEMAAKRLSTRLTVGTGRVQAAQEVEGGLLSRLLKTNDRRGSLLSQHPLASLLVLDGIVDHGIIGLGLKGAAVAAAGKAVKKAWEVPGRGIAMSGLAAENLSKLGLDGDLPEDRGRRARAVADRIRSTSPDDARRMASQAAQHVAKVSPDTLVSVGDTAAARHTALQTRVDQIFPPARGALRMKTPGATSSQARELERALSVASDPTAFARLLSEDRLTSADLTLARQTWPAHVDRAVRLASSWLAEHEGEVPRSIARRLELLLGAEAVGSQRDDSARAAQAAIAAAKERMKSPPKLPEPAGGSPREDLMPPSGVASTRPSD